MMLPFVNILPTAPNGIGAAKPLGGEAVSIGAGDGTTFASLMNLFGMAEPAPQNPVSPLTYDPARNFDSAEPSTQVNPAQAFAALLMANPSIVSSAANNSTPLPVQNALTENIPTEQASSANTQSPTDDIPLALTQPPSSPIPTFQTWNMTIAQQRLVDLKPGKYQVVQQDISNGTLRLKLTSKDAPAEPIKISIPIELLHQESHEAITPVVKQSTGVQISPKRVTIFTNDSTDLEQLIGKVNLREMEVSTQPGKSIHSMTDEPTTVQIFAEQAGQNFVLAGKLNRAQLKGQVSTKRALLSTAAVPDKSNPTPAAANALTVDTIAIPRRRVISRVAFEADGQARTEDFKLVEQLLATSPQDASAQSDGLDKATFAAKPINPQSVTDLRTLTPRVKISLPQELPQVKADGTSILLKIEPEHLGPAKLQLTLRNETLSARVTVDSAQAKAAVENSLDQLQDQLARVGVKVNYIEVGVRGGGADNQFFHRQADWFRAQQPRMMKLSEEMLAEVTSVIPSAIPVSYIGAGSVNVFA